MNARPTRLISAAAALVAGILLIASAAAAGPLKGRLKVQDTRIDRGVASGEITKREQAAMRGQQHAISTARDRAIANDGKINKNEAKRLTKAQNQASQDIYRVKHNSLSKD